MAIKNILVTGGTGRLGGFVCAHLKESGYNVAAFDVAPPKPESVNVKLGIPFVQGNLTNLNDLLRAYTFAQADAVVHLGAITHNVDLQPPFPNPDKNWQKKSGGFGGRFQEMAEDATMNINTMGSFYVLDAARRLGIKTVVMAASYFVLGIGFRLSGTPYKPSYLPMDEKHPLLPEDVYSLSKVLGEETGKAFSRAYGMRVVSMRLLGMYYHDNEMSSRMHKFNVTVPEAAGGDPPYFTGDTYQYADARDVAVFARLALEAKNLGPFEEFFVATDTKYAEPTAVITARRWPALAEMAKNIPGVEGLISIRKAQDLLGYKPAYSWRNQK